MVIPFYNEEDFLPSTLKSIGAQSSLPEKLILVNNASTDNSVQICKKICTNLSIPKIIHLTEEKPGKIHALAKTKDHIHTKYVAFGDADTYYPPHYLNRASELFQNSDKEVVAILAQYVEEDPAGSVQLQKQLEKTVHLSKRFPKKAFSGGAGHIFKTDAYFKAGGFSPKYWSFVHLDQEFIHRIAKHGDVLYHPDMWCLASTRREDRSKVRWNLWERVLYRYHPHWMGDWYFYRFLAARLKKKGMSQLNLRDQNWK